MHKATLGLGLQSGREDWFTSSSDGATLSKDWMAFITRWAFEEGCRRLGEGGWDGERTVSLSLIAHTNLSRDFDESREVRTRFSSLQARRILQNLFTEAWSLIVEGEP